MYATTRRPHIKYLLFLLPFDLHCCSRRTYHTPSANQYYSKVPPEHVTHHPETTTQIKKPFIRENRSPHIPFIPCLSSPVSPSNVSHTVSKPQLLQSPSRTYNTPPRTYYSNKKAFYTREPLAPIFHLSPSIFTAAAAERITHHHQMLECGNGLGATTRPGNTFLYFVCAPLR